MSSANECHSSAFQSCFGRPSGEKGKLYKNIVGNTSIHSLDNHPSLLPLDRTELERDQANKRRLPHRRGIPPLTSPPFCDHVPLVDSLHIVSAHDAIQRLQNGRATADVFWRRATAVALIAHRFNSIENNFSCSHAHHRVYVTVTTIIKQLFKVNSNIWSCISLIAKKP